MAELWKVGGGHCNLSLISYPRQWQITFMKWRMLTKQISAEECSHRKTSSREAKKRSGMVSLFHLCFSTRLCQLELDSSKTLILLFQYLTLFCWLSFHYPNLTFSLRLWDYLTDSKLAATRLGLLSSFEWYLVVCNYYAETINNSHISWAGVGSPVFRISNIFLFCTSHVLLVIILN